MVVLIIAGIRKSSTKAATLMIELSTSFKNVARDGLVNLDSAFSVIAPDDLTPLQSGGLSHDHVRIGDSGWLLRIPRGNQLGLEAKDYLNLQYACFTTAAKSRHAPAIAGLLAPNTTLPNGALVVEQIKGRKATSPNDAIAIARALAALHTIYPDGNTAVLQKAGHPFASQQFLTDVVFGEAPDRAIIYDESRILLKVEQERLRQEFERAKERFAKVPYVLIGGDSHPANFLIDDTGKATLVDVEFAMFDMPYIDLADASLPLTQRLDPDVETWSSAIRSKFYNEWERSVDGQLGNNLQDGKRIAEKAVKLRTLLWLADWTSRGAQDIPAGVSPVAQYNWDRMAKSYLEPQMISDVMRSDIYPYIPPVPAALRAQI